MAYGNNNYNNNQQNNDYKYHVREVQSNYKMNNGESDIDPTCLGFKFWKQNLVITISPRKNTGTDEVVFDYDNGISIYMNHTKAKMFKHEVEEFLKDPASYNSRGVNSGQSVICITNGTEYGKNTPMLVIYKLAEGGKISASYGYEFKTNFFYSLRNYTGDKYEQNFEDYKNIEIEQLVVLLDEFCKAMTNATAFTVLDQRQYSYYKMDTKIEAIASSLGVDIPKGNPQKKFNSDSYFRNNSNEGTSFSNNDVGYGTATIDDLE